MGAYAEEQALMRSIVGCAYDADRQSALLDLLFMLRRRRWLPLPARLRTPLPPPVTVRERLGWRESVHA